MTAEANASASDYLIATTENSRPRKLCHLISNSCEASYWLTAVSILPRSPLCGPGASLKFHTHRYALSIRTNDKAGC